MSLHIMGVNPTEQVDPEAETERITRRPFKDFGDILSDIYAKKMDDLFEDEFTVTTVHVYETLWDA